LTWVESPYAVAHPLDDGTAAVLEQSLDATTQRLGTDAEAWRALMKPFVDHAGAFFESILRPVPLIPRHPFLMARFGLAGLRSASAVMKRFRGDAARAIFGGCAAHAIIPPGWAGSAAAGISMAGSAHTGGAARGRVEPQSARIGAAARWAVRGRGLVSGRPRSARLLRQPRRHDRDQPP